jgi:hypothetical protein
MADDHNTMVFGVDTSHPPPKSNFPTMAAVVYSIDKYAAEYRSLVGFQEPRQELITNMKTIAFVRSIPRAIEVINSWSGVLDRYGPLSSAEWTPETDQVL